VWKHGSWSKKRELYKKESQKLLQNNSTAITLMTTSDFGDTRVWLNQLNSTIFGIYSGTAAYVPRAKGGMPKIS
jgi:hypothetical protein